MKSLSTQTKIDTLRRYLDTAITLVKIELDGLTVYAAEKTTTFDSQEYIGCLKDISTIHGRLDPYTLETYSGLLTLAFHNAKPVYSYEHFSDISAAKSFAFATVTVTWITANSSPGDEVTHFKGKAGNLRAVTDLACQLQVTEISAAMEDKLQFTKVNADDYANADPDDIGKVIPDIYGQPNMAPGLAVEAGGKDTLVADITNSDTSIILTDASEFPSSGSIMIEAEEIAYTGKSTNTLTGCSRGQSGTDAAAHVRGAYVWELVSQFVYILARHPVKAIVTVYVRGVRCTAGFTAYTGQTGDELAGYEGKAVIKFDDLPTISKEMDLTINDTIDVADTIAVDDTIAVVDTIDVQDTIAVSDTIGVSDGIGVSDTIGVNDNIGYTSAASTKEIYPNSGPANAIDGNENSYASVTTAGAAIGWAATSYGTVVNQYVWAKVGAGIWSASGWTGGGTGDSTGVYMRFSKAGGSWGDSITITPNQNSTLFEVYKVVDYTPTLSKTGAAYKSGAASKTGAATKSGSATKTGLASKLGGASKSGSASKSGAATKTGAVTLTGNSVADVLVGQVSADVQGYQDDGSGTYTGTPNALIERPDHIRKHMLEVLYGLTSAEWDSTSFDAAGSEFSSNSYTLSIVLNRVMGFREIQRLFAFQSRTMLFWSEGKEKMKWLSTAPAVDGTITDQEVKELSVDFSERDRITNRLLCNFNRRWDRDNNCWYAVATGTNGTSQGKFGTITKEYELPWVTVSAMAADVVAYWTTFFAAERIKTDLTTYWNALKYELGDVLNIEDYAPGQTNGILYAHQTGGDKSLMIIEAQHDKARETNRIMAIQMD